MVVAVARRFAILVAITVGANCAPIEVEATDWRCESAKRDWSRYEPNELVECPVIPQPVRVRGTPQPEPSLVARDS